MEPLHYAPPPAVRHGVVLSGFLAHVFASYAVGLCHTGFMAVSNGLPGEAISLIFFAAVSPLWVPLLLLFAVLLKGAVLPIAWICAYAALLFLAYRHLRKPRDV